MIVPKDKRITVKHIREMEKAGIKKVGVPDDFLLGRVLAHAVVDKESGEIVANANDEITEDLLAKLHAAGVSQDQHPLHQRSRSGRLHFPDPAHRRNADQAGRPCCDLPHDAPWRAAHRRFGGGVVRRPVLQRGALRPVRCRSHEVQPPCYPAAKKLGYRRKADPGSEYDDIVSPSS